MPHRPAGSRLATDDVEGQLLHGSLRAPIYRIAVGPIGAWCRRLRLPLCAHGLPRHRTLPHTATTRHDRFSNPILRSRPFTEPEAGSRPYSTWICTRLVVPGRPEGSPAVMPTRCPVLHQPSSTTRRAASAISASVVSWRRIEAACTPHISAQRRTVSLPGESA